MALRPAYLPATVAFDDFLFAQVGEERNGMPLSVISAFIRLDLDPWEKATQLSRLAAAEASAALALLIARLPVGLWRHEDAAAIATRLILLLPKPASVVRRNESGSQRGKIGFRSILWLICLALLAAGIFGMTHGSGASRGTTPSLDAAVHGGPPALISE